MANDNIRHLREDYEGVCQDARRTEAKLDRAVAALTMIANGHGCPMALAEDTLKAIQ